MKTVYFSIVGIQMTLSRAYQSFLIEWSIWEIMLLIKVSLVEQNFKKKKFPLTTLAFFLPLLRILSKYPFAEILYYMCSWQHDNLWSLSLLPLMKAKKDLDSPSASLYGRHWGCPKWVRWIKEICPWSSHCHWLMEKWIKRWNTKPMGT